MILDICRNLKESLSVLTEENNGFITQLSGLVKTATVYRNENKVMRFPVAVDEEDETQDCNEETVFKLVPDDRKRCIVYFEGNPATFVTGSPFSTHYQTKISLVCWYNRTGFVDSENLQSVIFSKLIEKVKTAEIEEGLFTGLKIKVIGFSDNNISAFSKYTYSDEDSAYTAYPFGFFQIDFQLNFTINENSVCTPLLTTVNLTNVC